ncbi:hypothetical protein NM688_g4040 [Phlebia brevispora]|uniref:Uncharacterized protein n=1 Tax=Phlebia brevispora TaxID=194682 RepID=A0ACC1T492_9APHY|nr:hypothetical protein NM688_g4040 [Phlebia brevispora]
MYITHRFTTIIVFISSGTSVLLVQSNSELNSTLIGRLILFATRGRTNCRREVLKYFRRVEKSELEALIPLGGSRLVKVTSQEPNEDSDSSSPAYLWTLVDIYELQLVLYNDPVAFLVFAFRRVSPFDTPTTLALHYVEIDNVNQDRRDELRDVLLLPTLDPGHLALLRPLKKVGFMAARHVRNSCRPVRIRTDEIRNWACGGPVLISSSALDTIGLQPFSTLPANSQPETSRAPSQPLHIISQANMSVWAESGNTLSDETLLSLNLSSLSLASDVWGKLPIDVLGEIAAQLPTLKGLERDSIVRHSETCKVWRSALSPSIFRRVTLQIGRNHHPAGVAARDTQEEEGDGCHDGNGASVLRRFCRVLDDGAKIWGKSIASCIKHLAITDFDQESNDAAWTAQRKNAELLFDVLRHITRLDSLKFQTVIPLDGFRIAELALRAWSSEPTSTHAWTPIDVDELQIEFWRNGLPFTTFAAVGIPRFLGILSLFRNVKRLEVFDSMPHSGEHFIPNNLPSLTNYLRLSKVKFGGLCAHPIIMQMIVSPSTTSELSNLDIGIIREHYTDQLKNLFSLPALDPEHLSFTIVGATSTSSPAPLDLVCKEGARLREISLELRLPPSPHYRFDHAAQALGHGGIARCVSKILSTLNVPRNAHSVRKIHITIWGITKHVDSATGPKLILPFRELDDTLFKLREGVHAIQTIIAPIEVFPYSPTQVAASKALLAELFPHMKESIQPLDAGMLWKMFYSDVSMDFSYEL